MPWVRLDDRFPSHRKISLLSDRAFRLHVSALCWSAENLTDGHIGDKELRVIAHVRGMKTTAKELEAAQLWDRVRDGWQIHDFLIYQHSREKVLAERQDNAARQQEFRDKQKAKKEAAEQAKRDAEAAKRNGVTPPVTYPVSNEAPSQHPYQASPTEKPASSARAPQVGPTIPGFAQPLVDAMMSARMVISWGLNSGEWLTLHAHIKRSTVPDLVGFIAQRWNHADPPRTARYVLAMWNDLPNTPAAPEADPNTPPGALVVLPGGQAPAGPPTRNQTKRNLLDQLSSKLADRNGEAG